MASAVGRRASWRKNPERAHACAGVAGPGSSGTGPTGWDEAKAGSSSPQ